MNSNTFAMDAFSKSKTQQTESFKCIENAFSTKACFQIFASFGGLIMRLIGEHPVLEKFVMDQDVFLLVRTFKPGSSKRSFAKRTLDV